MAERVSPKACPVPTTVPYPAFFPMPLPEPQSARTLAHTRSVRFEGYKREDGLWDIEGHLTDHSNRDALLASGLRRRGEPIHDMRIRLTVDASLRIVDAVATSDVNPYPGYCDRIAPDYAKLVGLTLARGFRRSVQELFGGVAGCTHLTEMLGQFPTAAIQAMAGEKRDNDDGAGKPFQLDRCHALDTRGEAVARYYPRWISGAGTRSNETS